MLTISSMYKVWRTEDEKLTDHKAFVVCFGSVKVGAFYLFG